MKCPKCCSENGISNRCFSCGASLVAAIAPTVGVSIEAPKADKVAAIKGVVSGGFWNFDKLITMAYIKWLFIIGCIAICLGVIGFIIAASMAQGFGGFIVSVIVAPIIGLFLGLFFRIACESIIIFFKIHQALQK